MVAPGVQVETDGEKYFRIIYYMPKQTLLTIPPDELETGVMDECVQRALAAGHIPVGAVWVNPPEDVEPDSGSVGVQLQEGSRINVDAFMEGLGMQPSVSVDMCKVVAEVAIGWVGREQ